MTDTTLDSTQLSDPSYRYWTENEINVLHLLHSQRVSHQDMAATIGRSVDAIERKLREENLTRLPMEMVPVKFEFDPSYDFTWIGIQAPSARGKSFLATGLSIYSTGVYGTRILGNLPIKYGD